MGSRLSLLDVLPQHETVDIGGGQQIEVYGISAEDIGAILHRYPDAFAQIIKAKGNVTLTDPALLGALLAASQRNGSEHSLLGNDECEQRARSLSVGAQMKIMQAIGRVTFPDGAGPFLQGLASMSSAANEAMRLVIQVDSKGRAMTSPPTPKPSEPPATQASGS
jgi:hypothetical protein